MRKQLEELGIKVVHQTGQELVAYCPLHEDKHPSFSYNIDSGLFHCFNGCLRGRGLKALAASLGQKLSNPPLSDSSTYTDHKPLPLIPELPLAIGNHGEDFLVSRGFTKSTIREWNLLFWDEKKAIVIPYPNVGFILRFLEASETKSKYKYMHGTKITESLFGVHKFVPRKFSVVLVEGAFDVIWMHQNNFQNTLACLHSDATPSQIQEVWKLAKKTYLMFDADEGGEKATKKVGQKLWAKGMLVYKCVLPDKQDPNDSSREQIQEAISGAQRWTPL